MENRRGSNTPLEDGVAEAKYTRFGERIRQVFPGPMQCSMACGGKNCKWENPARWSDADQAIKGVFSSWVLDNVVAMSRPSTQIIEKYGIIEQFKRHNISSIINLQRPGEHASCGPPLDKESLFTYKPQLFMDNDVFFYNFGWKDFGVTSLNTILDMVKVMCFALEEGNVAVHCHAGLGRTGVLIACYLVFAHRMEPDAAILRVRKNRSNSIQTRGQIACIHEFSQFLRPLRIVFPQVVPHSKRLTLKQFLIRQRHLLHGFESRRLKHTPKLVHTVCMRLAEIADCSENDNPAELAEDETSLRRCNTVAEIKETIPGAFVNENTDETTSNNEKQIPLSGSPTDVDAVLSPRISRRGSARTSSTSETAVRPQSADYPSLEQSEDDIFANTNDEQEWKKAKRQSSAVSKPPTPILVASRNRALSAQSRSDQDPIDPSAKLVMVKQVPSSGGINLTEGVSVDENDPADDNELVSSNSNNNHSVTEASFASINLDIDEDANIELSENENNQNNQVQEENAAPVQSAMDISGRGVKSLVMSINNMAAIESTILAEVDGPASVRKMRLSAGRSETILPTGLPSKSHRNSAKSRLPTPGLEENAGSTKEKELQPEVNDDQSTENEKNAEQPDIEASSAEEKLEKPPQNEAFDTENPNSVGVLVQKLKPAVKPTDSSRGNTSVNIKRNQVNMVSYNDLFPAEESNRGERFQSLPQDLEESETSVSENCGDFQRDTAGDVSNDALELQVTFGCPSTVVVSTVPATSAAPIAADLLEVTDSVALSLEPQDPSVTDDDTGISFSTGPKDDDDDLDEIIDIMANEGPSFSDTENEEESTNDRLSSSMASKVSWTKQMNSEGTVKPEERNLSASSKTSGRRTPLMYRAQKNIELLNGTDEQTNCEEDDSKSDSSGNHSDATKELEPPVTDSAIETDAHLLGYDLSPAIPRVISTKSLNDLQLNAEVPQFLACDSNGSSEIELPKKIDRGPTAVARAFSYKLIDDEFLWEKVYLHQIELNMRTDAWEAISGNSDAFVLSALMWSWVEHLAEPVITKESKRKLLEVGRIERDGSEKGIDAFESALSSLDPEVTCTVRCLLDCILSFPTFPKHLAIAVVDRTVAALTQTPIKLLPETTDNQALTNLFHDYVDVKYAASSKLRYFVEGETAKVETETENVESDMSSDAEEATDPEKTVILPSSSIDLPRSASSIRSSSSGGSSTSVILLQSSIACS